jgi:hypothetical protein
MDPYTINITEENQKLDKELLIARQKDTLLADNQFILLMIDAQRLYNLGPIAEQHEIDKCCILEDNQHSSQLAPLRNFVSEVSIDSEVSWDARSVDDGYFVSIEGITYKHPFFETNPIVESVGSDKGVTAKVRKDESLIDRIFEYSIHFRIDFNGEPREFMIDPKLCANT